MINWSIDQLIGLLIDPLTDWMFDWLVPLIDQMMQ